MQVDARAGNGADSEGSEASLRLLPDPTVQERLFAAHLAGKLPIALRSPAAGKFGRPA